MKSLREVSLVLFSVDAVDPKQGLMGAFLHLTNCSHLRNKEQFKELKRRRRKAEVGDRYNEKKWKIVMEELAIMNLFLIPLLHMLLIIP